MKGVRLCAAAIVLGFAILAGGMKPLLQSRQQILVLRQQNAEMKREIDMMRERLQPQAILCAGTFSSGCGNGPRPASPWEHLKR